MKEEDKHLEDFVDKIMSAQKTEKPSVDFTAKIMASIQAGATTKKVEYQPLITRPVWAVLLSAFVAIITFITIKQPFGSIGIIDSLNMTQLLDNPFGRISFNISSTFMYSVVLFAVMLGIQIPLLKNYFNKRVGF